MKQKSQLNIKLIVAIEESINKRLVSQSTISIDHFFKVNDNANDSEISYAINKRLKEMGEENMLYSQILFYIKRMNNSKYKRKNGEINESAFYKDAFIDKSTWSNIRWGNTTPQKKTLLKLIFALRLNEEEANTLMALGSSSLNPSDPRDMIVLALIDVKCYDIYTIYDVMDEYGKNGKRKFDNIYDEKYRDDE